MKSLFSGALLGLLTGGIAAGAASVIAPQPAGNTPPAAPQVQAPIAAAETPVPADPQPEIATVAEPATTTSAPSGLAIETPAALPETDTSSAQVPVAEDVATDLTLPEESDVPEIVAGSEEPVLPNPQSVAPQVPASEDDLVVSTEPAAEPQPVVAEVPVEVIVEEEPAAVEEELAVVEDVVEAEVAATPEVVEVPVVVEVDDAQEGEVVAQTQEVTEAPEVVATAPDDVQPPNVQETDVQTPVAEAAAPTSEPTPTLTAPAAGDSGPAIGGAAVDEEPVAPVVISVNDTESGSRLPQGVSNIPVNRATGSEDAPSDDVVTQDAPIDPDAPAIDQFAATFENPDNKPTMSVILVDDGSFVDAAATLGQVPFPVTVVLDPTVAGAAQAMAAYRAAGIEVAVLAALPEGARPSDVEVAFAAAFGALPETVALVDPGEGNLQGDRAVMAQAMAALAEDGRGLVTISRGLNTGVQAAVDAGVPTGLIFRDLDNEGQDSRVIGRFLDQAAFRARQEPGVILLARVRAETLEALIAWGDENRAGQVAMAPVSAVLSSN